MNTAFRDMRGVRPASSLRPEGHVRGVSHIEARHGISALTAACVATLLALASGCHAVYEGPSRAASSDPIAAAEATQRGDWRDAADRWFAVYLAGREKSAKPIVETAHALLMLEDPESANNIVDLGMRDHPEDSDLLAMKGDVLVALGFRRPAESYYQRAIEIDPGHRRALEGLGRARIELGLEGAAVAPLQRLIEIAGDNYEREVLLARALKGAGDQSGAFVAWRKAFALGGGSIADMLVASTLCLDADVRRQHPTASATCRGWLERAIAADPQCTQAHFQLGLIAEGLGSYDDAIAHYRRAVETDPACLRSLTNLAILYVARGDEPNAREMVTRALEIEQDADRRKALLKLLGPFEKKPEQRL